MADTKAAASAKDAGKEKAPAVKSEQSDAKPEKQEKPEKPDDEVFKKNLAKLEKEHKETMEKFNAVREKINSVQTPRDQATQNPTQKRRKELYDQLAEIRKKQAGFKNAKSNRMDQVKRYDEQLKSKINEQKNAKSKIPYKSVEELDSHVAKLEADVERGNMPLVAEKKALAEVSQAKKMRKQFTTLDAQQSEIDSIKAKIKELKDGGDNPEQKKLNDEYEAAQKELNEINKQAEETFGNLNALRDERTRLHKLQQDQFLAIKKHKDDYYAQRRAVQEWEKAARKKYRERREAEEQARIQERKKKDAAAVLEDASNPAFMDEIRRATGLLHFLDPSTVGIEKKAPLLADKGLAAQASRKVDDSGFKGMKVVKKADEEYLPAAKKGKKGRKHGGDVGNKAYNCPPSVIDDCRALKIDPPMSQNDVPELVKKIQEMISTWKANQEDQTKKNIEDAKKKLAALEAAENGTNGSNDKKVEEVAEKLEKTEIKE